MFVLAVPWPYGDAVTRRAIAHVRRMRSGFDVANSNANTRRVVAIMEQFQFLRDWTNFQLVRNSVGQSASALAVSLYRETPVPVCICGALPEPAGGRA